MKRLIALCLVCLMVLPLVSCASSLAVEETVATETRTEEKKEDTTPFGKVSTPTLKNKIKGQIKVSFKEVDTAVGYEIMYSTSEYFTTETTKTITTTKTTQKIKKLTKNQTYYVKVRAYKNNSMGGKVLATYSDVQSIKVKK